MYSSISFLLWFLVDLLHDDFTGHMAMNGTEIWECAWFFERERELVVSVERARLERIRRAANSMWHVVFIGPGYGRAFLNCQFLRAERKIVDRDFFCCGIMTVAFRLGRFGIETGLHWLGRDR